MALLRKFAFAVAIGGKADGLEYIVAKHEMLTIRSSVSDIFVMLQQE